MLITPVLIAVGTMGGMGLIFAGLLVFANSRLRVKEDPKVCAIAALLPAANCGGCGFAGCANFAENLVAGRAVISACPVCSQGVRSEISTLLGTIAENSGRKVAVVLCRAHEGGKKKALYRGVETCLAASLVSGGERSCNYGCIGYGDCVRACPFDAIHMSTEGLPIVNRQKCTGCNRCVEACPRRIIELHPINHHYFVLCKNLERGKAAKDSCANACLGCGLCVRAVGGAGLQVLNNLAQIDYEKITGEIESALVKCPTHTIQFVGYEGEE